MAMDIATLGIKVDATQADKAGISLDKLASAGDRAETSTRGATSAAAALNQTLAKTSSATAAAEVATAKNAKTASQMADRMAASAAAARLTGNEMLNMSRQFSDVGVQLAMGMNPLMILIQQGPQIADTLTVAGQRGVTAGAAFRQMGASLYAALAPVLPMVLALSAGVAVVGGAFAIMTKEAEKGLGDVQREFGFTEKQMKRLKEDGVDTGYTMGDAFKAFGMTVSDLITDAFGPQIDAVKQWFSEWYNYVVDGAANATGSLVGNFIGAYLTIKESWRQFPAAIADASVQAVNHVIEAVERMVNKSAEAINSLLDMLPGWARPEGRVGSVSLGRMENDSAGAAANLSEIVQTNMARGREIASGIADRFSSNMAEARTNRLKDAAGDADKGQSKRSGKSQAEREYERQLKAARDFAQGLREETAAIGKNRIEVKMMAAERAAALAPTSALKEEIRASAAAWKEATIAHANSEFKRGLQDEIEQLRFENSLIGMNAAAREEALAVREIELRIREQERQGLTVNRAAIEAETAAIIANARARGEREDAIANARAITDAVYDMTDALRESVNGFGELFGTAGAGFESLINVMADYADRRADLQERIAEADTRTAEGQRERQRATDEMARAEIAHYGNMLGAAKGFFDEGSAGFKTLEAAERAYRIFQFAMQVRAMLMDKAETASSVANSGARAAADGVAAIAKAIASLPFPLNLAAGAATAAALVAFGVKLFGGGKGKGAATGTASASSAVDAYSGPRDEYGAPTSFYSVLKPGQTTVANDNAVSPHVGSAAASRGGDTYSPTYNIDARGAEPGVENRLREVLFEHEDRVVLRARKAAAADRAASDTRQRIGGGG